MFISDKILDFYNNLRLDNESLPEGIEVMNPFSQPSLEFSQILRSFYTKFYEDDNPRGLILGINPGRFGAGQTGIPFTDSFRLKSHCDIDISIETRETSSVFIYDMIDNYGGARKFYGDWFLGAVSPLGFIHKNEKGNWVNYNYYDNPELEAAVRPFIIDQIKTQSQICGNPETCIILGTGKNYSYLKRLNNHYKLFRNLIPLEHPRYIMQYRLKDKSAYIDKYLEVLFKARL